MVFVVVINDVNVKKIGQAMIVHVPQKTTAVWLTM